jgi:hypothetical protein
MESHKKLQETTNQQVFSPLPNINDDEDEINTFLDVPCQMALPIKPFTP